MTRLWYLINPLSLYCRYHLSKINLIFPCANFSISLSSIIYTSNLSWQENESRIFFPCAVHTDSPSNFFQGECIVRMTMRHFSESLGAKIGKSTVLDA